MQPSHPVNEKLVQSQVVNDPNGAAFTEFEFKDSLDFLDFSFKLERGLSTVRASYFNAASLDLLSVIVYAIIFHSSPFYFWLSMLIRPLRGIIGFYLSMTIPRTDELIDRIDYNDLKTK